MYMPIMTRGFIHKF